MTNTTPTPERDRGDEHPMSKQMRGILVINKTPPGYSELLNSWADEMDRLLAELDEQRAVIERLQSAVTPSSKTKAAYSGEFTFMEPVYSEEGETAMNVVVPWITIKEIMRAIEALAASGGSDE